MCGFAGILWMDGPPVRRDELIEPGETIKHRGGDSSGYYISNELGIVHHRLALKDNSPLCTQPMLSKNEDKVLAFNGQISNFKSIRKELKNSGFEFETRSDTETLLYFLMKNGFSTVNNLDGMFAFSYYDKNEEILHLVRDFIGIKPLYYTFTENRFIFASEIKAILSHKEVKKELDKEILPYYLEFQALPPGRTLFKSIYSVKPGEILSIKKGEKNLKSQIYWWFPEEEDMSYEEVLANVRTEIIQSVDNYSQTDFELGVMLSGGIDSSLIALILDKILDKNKDFSSFSSLYDYSEIKDERKYSRIVSSLINSRHKEIFLDRNEIIKAHENLIYLLDYPEGGPSAPYLCFAQELHKSVKICLSGNGGDELFGGYPKILSCCKALGIENISKKTYGDNFKKANEEILSLSGKSPEKIIHRSFSRSSFLVDSLKDNLNIVENYNPQEFLMSLMGNGKLSVQNLLNIDRKILLPALLHVDDRVSMFAGIEGRSPMLGKKVIEAACRIPSFHIFKNGLKSVLKDSFKDLLPEEILNRTDKCGIVYPVFCEYDRGLKNEFKNKISILDSENIFKMKSSEIINNSPLNEVSRVKWTLYSLGSFLDTFDIKV